MFVMKSKLISARLIITLFLILAGYSANAAIECDFNVTQSWGSGGNGQISITNTGDSTVTLDPITAEFPAGITVASSWHMALSGNNPYTFTPYGWNASIGPGRTITAGMSLGGNVSSSTEAVLGGACGGNATVNTPPTAALQCDEMTMVGDAPMNGFSLTQYVMRCISESTDPDGDMLDMVFDWGDGTPVGSQATHRYVESGTYTIYLTVNDGEFSDTASVQVPATGNTLPPVAELICQVTGNTATCDGSQSSDPDGDPLNFVYQWGDGETGVGGNTATHTYAETGTYTVGLIVTDAHNAAGDNTTVVIADVSEPPLDAEFSYTVDGLNVAVDVPYDATAGIIHTWNWGDGSAESTGFPQSHTYAQAGTYTVTLTLEDEAGRTGSVSHEITVTDENHPETQVSCSLAANNFSNGFLYSITLTNQGESVLSGWEVCLVLDDDTVITNYFNSTPVIYGNQACFNPVAWNHDINPGQSFTFGFMGSGPGTILHVEGTCNSLN